MRVKNLSLCIFLWIVCMVVGTLLSKACHAETQAIGQWGYSGYNGGQSFAHGPKSDREIFDGQIWEVGAVHWWDSLGIGITGGKSLGVDTWAQPGLKFKQQLKFANLTGQYRWELGDWYPIFGVGINYSRMKNTFERGDKQRREVLRDFGWLGLLGLDYRIAGPLLLTVEAQWVDNAQKSELYRRTNWMAGGLRVFGGFKISI